MNEEQAGAAEPVAEPEENASLPLLEQARQIERDMFNIMTHQLRMAIIQVVLGLLSILAACVLALLQ